jgi:diacylglycerol kinase family enzyme
MPAPPTDGPVFVVLNARSGHDDAQTARAAIEAVLRAAGRAHTLLPVHEPAQLRTLTAQAVESARAAHGIVVAAGGDGTINTVAQATLGSGCAFGVVPQGTFNYFSRVHGIPLDAAEATRALVQARAEPVQLGAVNGHIFIVNASVGLYPQLLEDRETYKRELGRHRLVALWAALMTLLQAHRPLRLLLQAGGTTQSVRTQTLFVGNNALQLQRVGIPDGALERGALVAVMLRPVGTAKMLWLMLRGAFGRLGEADDVLHFGFERLTLQPAPPFGTRRMKLGIDGEIVWLRAPLVFGVAPEPLWLLKP